jgi:putative cell wall-binding protein
VEPTRIAGADRYETAARISADGASTSPPQAQTVLVASGASYADALGGAAAGAASAAPLLLTDPQSLPDATATEITRLHPTDVFVLGGTGAVSDAVADAIRALGPSVTRIAGANRYETSAMIATTIFSNGASEAMLATGLDFPDGLVAGAIGHPVLLLPRADDVPAQIPDAVAALSVTVLTIMGGSAAVSDAQASAVAAARR